MDEKTVEQFDPLPVELWEFCKTIKRHWLWAVSSSFVAVVVELAFQAGGVVITWGIVLQVAMIGLVVACFMAYRDERRAKQTLLRIPNIEGFWMRNDNIVPIEIRRNGEEFSIRFDANGMRHRATTRFYTQTRRFEHLTTRTIISTGEEVPYIEFIWWLDDTALLYYAPQNAIGMADLGIIRRHKF
jgi:hypothetical protein